MRKDSQRDLPLGCFVAVQGPAIRRTGHRQRGAACRAEGCQFLLCPEAMIKLVKTKQFKRDTSTNLAASVLVVKECNKKHTRLLPI